MMNNELVSVIIPTYNRAVYLQEALQSCIAQTYRPIQCIIVDDGSTDDTRAVVKEFEAANTTGIEWTYHYQTNSGAQVARNAGTALAKGMFIQYLDSDDILYPGKLQAQVDYLRLHPDCDAVFGDWEEGERERKDLKKAYLSEDLVKQFLTEKSVTNFSMLMRIELLLKIGDWDVLLQRNQEIDYQLRAVLAGGKFAYEPIITGLWRIHEGERIANTTAFDTAIFFYKKWERILKEKQLWSKEMALGIVGNYMWFLKKYPVAPSKQMVKLLVEIQRLNPAHPIFNTKKFRLAQCVLGQRRAILLWVSRFQKRI